MSGIGDDIRRSFDLASLRREAANKLSGEDWRAFRKIKETIDAGRRFAQRDYALDYKSRVEIERKRIIARAGAKEKSFTPFWSRNDRFDAAATLRQAQRNVRKQHEQVMARLDRREREAVHALLGRAETRNQTRETPKQDFARATDRRTGIERRMRRIRTRD